MIRPRELRKERREKRQKALGAWGMAAAQQRAQFNSTQFANPYLEALRNAPSFNNPFNRLSQ